MDRNIMHGVRVVQMLRMNSEPDDVDPGLAAHQLEFLLDIPEHECAHICRLLVKYGSADEFETRGGRTAYWIYKESDPDA